MRKAEECSMGTGCGGGAGARAGGTDLTTTSGRSSRSRLASTDSAAVRAAPSEAGAWQQAGRPGWEESWGARRVQCQGRWAGCLTSRRRCTGACRRWPARPWQAAGPGRQRGPVAGGAPPQGHLLGGAHWCEVLFCQQAQGGGRKLLGEQCGTAVVRQGRGMGRQPELPADLHL